MAYDATPEVNESTASLAEVFGKSLQQARKARRLTQRSLATHSGVDIVTVRELERGRGTVGPLVSVLVALEYRFSAQPAGEHIGSWIASQRKAAGHSQTALAVAISVSKPTIIQFERGKGTLQGLLRAMDALGLEPKLVPVSDPFRDVRLICGDSISIMSEMPDASVDLIFTSPPYNLKEGRGDFPKRYGMWNSAKLRDGYESHSDDLPYAEYVDWQKRFLLECWRLLADDGAIFYQHKNRVQNGVLRTPHDLNPGLPLRQVIIWDRGSGLNFSPTFLTPSHEVIYVFAKAKFRLKRSHGLKDVLKVLPDRGNPHPAPFPVELPRQIISATNAQTVLDPFCGSGSTALAAISEGRKFVGIDIDQTYLALAEARLRAGAP